MKKTKKRILKRPLESLRPEKMPRARYRFLWWCCLYLTLTAGSILALTDVWRDAPLSLPILVFYDIWLFLLAWLSRFRPLKRRWLEHALPWAAVLPLLVLGNPIAGGGSWVNSFLQRWNENHQAMVRQLSVAASPMDETAFAVLMLTAASRCSAWLLRRKHLWLGLGYMLALLAVSLLGAPDRGVATALLLAALLGYLLSGPTVDTGGQAAAVWCLASAVLLAGGLLPGKPVPSISAFREGAEQWIREFRYGREQLPLGDLSKAAELKKNEETALLVRSEEMKNLYLKAFTGGSYSDGRWEALPDSAYGGDNTGLFSWLKNQGFRPQTQLALYNSLCQTPYPQNTVELQVEEESRYRLYVPASLDGLGSATARFRQDLDPTAKGLFGKSSYRYTEASGTRPGELSLLESWVANPTTEAQRQYAQAEAVYREFVYQNYTQVDSGLAGPVRAMFHREEPESDSVFSVLTHVRDVLRQQCARADGVETPAGQDPVRYFLTVSHSGNAMLFASAAVEALRSYGIPARYAEGYYCTATQLETAKGDMLRLSGDAAHAWVEIYFDGMGWIAVDVTPGYYYDLVALQQLVSLPEDVTKTADLSKNEDKAGQLPDGEDGQEGREENAQPGQRNMLWLWLMLAVALVLAVLALAVMELTRGCAMLLLKRRFSRSDALERAKLMEKLLFRVLSGWGIQAGLGWNTKGLDALLPGIFVKVEPGEYKRVCGLLEKSVYGEIPPEIYEERTIVSFLKKLSYVRPGSSLRGRFLARYRWVDLA